MLSYWEKQHLLSADAVILGSGICGLSVACSIMERFPEKRVIILEKGVLPSGASTRNAGFACIGSLTEKLADLQLMGEEGFLKLISSRWEGLCKLRERLGDDNIGYESHGGYELILEGRQINQDELQDMNQRLKPIFDLPVFSFANEKIAAFGFGKVKQMIFNHLEGQLNTGLMMRCLMDYARQLGVQIITGAQVEAIDSGTEGYRFHLAQSNVVFTGETGFICTNAFSKPFLPNEVIHPGRGQVLITKPIPGLPFKGIFHFDEGYYYFRNVDDRILFGGGRNMDFEGETTTEMVLNMKIQQRLDELLQSVILPGHSIEVDMRWSGIMAFSPDKMPLIKEVKPGLYTGTRLNGMGVALSSQIGDLLCNMAFGK